MLLLFFHNLVLQCASVLSIGDAVSSGWPDAGAVAGESTKFACPFKELVAATGLGMEVGLCTLSGKLMTTSRCRTNCTSEYFVIPLCQFS
jgi:hypothetical protein